MSVLGRAPATRLPLLRAPLAPLLCFGRVKLEARSQDYYVMDLFSLGSSATAYDNGLCRYFPYL